MPRPVREKIDKRRNEDDGARGGRESYFEILELRKTILLNWDLFSDRLAEGHGNKDLQTHWIEEFNDIRVIVAHPSKGIQVSFEQLERLKKIDAWLDKTLGV